MTDISSSSATIPKTVSGIAPLMRREPYFLEDDLSIATNHFYIPEHYQDTLDSLLVPHGMIVDRVEKLAYDITTDYEGHTIHLLCVLKGGSTFFMDLCNAMRKFHNCALILHYCCFEAPLLIFYGVATIYIRRTTQLCSVYI